MTRDLVVPTSGWEVLALQFARRELQSDEFYLNFCHLGIPPYPITLDYFVWIVRDGSSTILIDTGYSQEAARSRSRPWLIAPVELLRRAGIDPEEIDKVLLTHCHWDHTGNVAAFPNADVLLAQSEYDFAVSAMAMRQPFQPWIESADTQALRRLDAAGRLELIDKQCEPFPGVVMSVIGGHTPGQAIVTVATENGPVIVASDAVHTYEEIETDRPFLLCSDVVDMLRGYDTVRDLARQPGAQLIPGHDPRVTAEFELVTEIPDGHIVNLGRPTSERVLVRAASNEINQ
jgi:glyoxylase-like metal-dependent hydrolase (beta-lactamase superfamily II)